VSVLVPWNLSLIGLHYEPGSHFMLQCLYLVVSSTKCYITCQLVVWIDAAYQVLDHFSLNDQLLSTKLLVMWLCWKDIKRSEKRRDPCQFVTPQFWWLGWGLECEFLPLLLILAK